MAKVIVLCADDYGQAPSISTAILDLLGDDRLSATSCLVNFPDWLEQAKALLAFEKYKDIGLHFSLTEGQPLSRAYRTLHGDKFFSLPVLLKKAFLGEINKAIIASELNDQIDHFKAGTGFLPHYIDGHQHIHQFPIIRDAIVKVFKERFPATAYIRLVQTHYQWRDVDNNLKNLIIYLSGCRPFSRLLHQSGIKHNTSFAGIYPFSRAHKYPEWFAKFLHKIGEGGIIMCHPGKSSKAQDPIAVAREQEYKYLTSDRFIFDCKANGVRLGRF